MRDYIHALPGTNAVVIYFNANNEIHVQEDLRIFHTGGLRYIVNCGPRGNWVYAYRPSALRYLFTRVDSKVKAFLGTASLEQTAGACMEIASIGSHLTIGLRQKGGKTLMNTHFTKYEEDADKPFEFIITRPYECWTELPESASKDCLNIGNLRPDGRTLAGVYASNMELFDLIEKVRGVFNGTIQVGSGPRGGRYVTQDGQKQYITRVSTVQGGTLLEAGVLNMIYEYVVRPVRDVCRKEHLQDITPRMYYDPSNYFQAETSTFVLLYEIQDHDTCRVFYLDAEHVMLAYNAYQYDKAESSISARRPPNQQSRRCFEELKTLASQHTKAMAGL